LDVLAKAGGRTDAADDLVGRVTVTGAPDEDELLAEADLSKKVGVLVTDITLIPIHIR